MPRLREPLGECFSHLFTWLSTKAVELLSGRPGGLRQWHSLQTNALETTCGAGKEASGAEQLEIRELTAAAGT